jgi:hypothetical protein
MPEPFLSLGQADRRDALLKAAGDSGRPPHLLEKDVWLVWTLQQLFDSSFGGALVFKGGTSLSKAFGVIDRFSEDIDLTYDIRSIAGDLIHAEQHWIPKTRSQQKLLSDAIRKRIPLWLAHDVLPHLAGRAGGERFDVEVSQENDVILLKYKPAAESSGYVSPIVKMEFGGRATGEPCTAVGIMCDASQHLPTLEFPAATVRVMLPERTFWEKATAIHVFCKQGKAGGGAHFSRHYYDIRALDAHGYARTALADRDLAQQVAEHKTAFFREQVDYHQAVSGKLQLIPENTEMAILADDYNRMTADGLLPASAPSFEALMEHVRDLERRANETASRRSEVE